MMEHTCSYYCERPECIRAQRDELRERLESAEAELADKADPKLAERLREEWEWLENEAGDNAALMETAELLRDAAAALGGGK
jgi:hypothetical protein